MVQENVLMNEKKIRCSKCGTINHSKATYKWINTCDECGKKETGLSFKGYLGDFYEITIFRGDNSERRTFCTPKHMARYIKRIKPKTFSSIFLPYVQGHLNNERSELKRNLTVSALKRILK